MSRRLGGPRDEVEDLDGQFELVGGRRYEYHRRRGGHSSARRGGEDGVVVVCPWRCLGYGCSTAGGLHVCFAKMSNLFVPICYGFYNDCVVRSCWLSGIANLFWGDDGSPWGIIGKYPTLLCILGGYLDGVCMVQGDGESYRAIVVLGGFYTLPAGSRRTVKISGTLE